MSHCVVAAGMCWIELMDSYWWALICVVWCVDKFTHCNLTANSSKASPLLHVGEHHWASDSWVELLLRKTPSFIFIIPVVILHTSVSTIAWACRGLVNHPAIGTNGWAFCGQRWLPGVSVVVTPGSRWVSRAHTRRKHNSPANFGSSDLQRIWGETHFNVSLNVSFKLLKIIDVIK